METSAKKKRIITKFWVKLGIFVIIMLFLLSYAVYVLTPKYDYGICSIMNMYEQPDDSIDVLMIGTSQTYSSVNTNILWEEFGIASYDLGTAEQPYWLAYYYLYETLKTQSPKLVVIDTKACSYPNDHCTAGRTVLGTYGIKNPITRIKAILQCAEPGTAMDFLLGFTNIHAFYEKLTPDSFALPPTNEGRGSSWKGYIEQDKTEEHERPSLEWSDDEKEINAHEMEYFVKMLDLCQENELPVLLVTYPYPDYAYDHMYINSLLKTAEQYDNIQTVNYNEPDMDFGISYLSDFADWQHLNTDGAVIFSRKFALDLKNMYDLPDRRGNEYYSSYDECAEAWFDLYPQYRQELLFLKIT